MEYYFETDDKLDRKRYAEFLKSMLENCDKYRREDSDGAYVIAIDSPWGTGKTRFAKMLRNFLEDRTKEMGDDSLPGDSASFNAIYYNSWETDFSDDALLPLIHSIISSPEFKEDRFKRKSKQVLNKFKEAATAVARVAVYTVLHNLAGEKVTEMVKAADDALSQKPEDPLKSYQERLKLLDDFRKALEKIIEQTNREKLVIIIDELDRCRPTFAIQTLELAKHLFAIKGLVFIFALDIKQLSCAVKTVYGQEMDTTGYLGRFFDYSTGLPNVDVQRFIENSFESYRCYSKEKIQLGERKFNELYQKVINLLCVLFYESNLSLRDITTIIASIKILNGSFLCKYKNHSAHLFYIFLLFLKYKHGDLYKQLTSEKTINVELSDYIKDKLGFSLRQDILEQVTQLNDKYLIGSKHHEIFINDKVETRNVYIRYANVSSSNMNIIKMQLSHGTNAKDDTDLEVDGSVSIDKTLFLPELSRWESIRTISLSKLVRQQLEMFNFALPADEPAAES